MISTLRDALHQNIHESGVPIKRLADELGMSYSYLANAGNPNLEGFDFQLRKLLPLMKATNNTAVLDYLEHSMGRVAFRVPEATGQNMPITAELLEMVKHMGELAGKIESALGDNVIQKHEAKGIEPILYDLARHCMRLMQTLTEVSK